MHFIEFVTTESKILNIRKIPLFYYSISKYIVELNEVWSELSYNHNLDFIIGIIHALSSIHLSILLPSHQFMFYLIHFKANCIY